MVSRGGWLTIVEATERVHIARGNKTLDFYSLEHVTGTFETLANLPVGPSGKLPYTGGCGVSDGSRYVYHARGNGSLEFMRYDVTSDSWQFLPDIPTGTWPKVKGGSCIEYASRNDTGYVYLLKGRRWDFLRYNTVTGDWTLLPPPPFEPQGKQGTWLCYDLERFLYALPAKGEAMYRFDTAGDSWFSAPLSGMPLTNNQTGKLKKPGDGGGSGWHDGYIYALKGGNTQDFYWYCVRDGQWSELETIPAWSGTGRKRRVKSGGCLVSYRGGNVPVLLFALKGNKTDDLWVYERYRTDSLAAMSGPARIDVALPRPAAVVVRSRSVITASDGAPHTVRFDALGRRVNATGSLRPGVYYVGPNHRRVVVVR
jgi:hypothetical protein